MSIISNPSTSRALLLFCLLLSNYNKSSKFNYRVLHKLFNILSSLSQHIFNMPNNLKCIMYNMFKEAIQHLHKYRLTIKSQYRVIIKITIIRITAKAMLQSKHLLINNISMFRNNITLLLMR